MDERNRKQIEHCVTLEEDDVPSEAVARAIAQAKGSSPLEIPTLYESVDPEALDTVVEGRDFSYIQFPFCGYTVMVVSDGRIIVQDCETNEGSADRS